MSPEVITTSSIIRGLPPSTRERARASTRRTIKPVSRAVVEGAKMQLHPPMWVAASTSRDSAESAAGYQDPSA